jgi:uncharacterized membrane protein
VLLFSWVVFRAMAWPGIARLATWRASADNALAAMLLVTGSAHFTSMKHALEGMVPPVFPRPMWTIYATGGCEFLGAAGLFVPNLRSLAGACLMVLLVAMFAANLRAARERVPLRGKRDGVVVALADADILDWARLVGEPIVHHRGGSQPSCSGLESREKLWRSFCLRHGLGRNTG